MRRVLVLLLLAAAAPAALAASPYALDRTGVLWRAVATPAGLELSGERDGARVVQDLVPFPLTIAGSSDSEIQVVADELTGKVAVVWQRSWSESSSEILAAVWKDGWEQLVTLAPDLAANPRSPLTRLSQVRTTVEAATPDEQAVVEDSFLQVIWWEGTEAAQHASYALLRLTAAPDSEDRLIQRNLDELLTVGIGCSSPVPVGVLEHPLFAAGGPRDDTRLFFGTQQACLFQLVEVGFQLEEPNPEGFTVTAQRRRHVPVFGVRKVYPVPMGMDLAGARILLGRDLAPVAYRVGPEQVQYLVGSADGWSDPRTLAVSPDLTVDQAIALVENLAR
jgi:hypothetical protein